MTKSCVKYLIESIQSARMNAVPWGFAYFDRALPTNLASSLSPLFADTALAACERNEGPKSYRFLTATLDASTHVPNAAGAVLLDFLRGQEYRSLIAELTGVPLKGRDATVNLWEYRCGDWLAPHVDKPDKLVTQIFYLTEHWSDGDGGRLLVLADSDLRSLVHALPPRFGSSVVIVRSDNSWHAVEQVLPDAAPRRTLTVTFWRG